MSAGRWVILIVLLGAAFGAGHVVGSSGAQHAAPDLTTPSRPAVGSVEEPEAVLRGRPGPTLATTAAGDAEAAVFERALAELPPLDVPRGDGRIDVIVKTEDGTAVPGVRVTCVPEMPKDLAQPRREGWQDDVSAAQMLLDGANRLRWRKQALVEAVTDAAGACSLEGLTTGKHAVTAQADGWYLRSTTRNIHEVEPGATIEFTAKPRTRVRISVVLPDGTAPERAQIRFHRGNGSTGRSWSPDRPDVDADVGTWDVSATAGDGELYRSQTEQVTVEQGRPSPEIRLLLVERTVLKTTVVPAEGEALAQVSLRQVRVPSGVRPDPALLGSVNDRAHLHSHEGSELVNRSYDLEPGTWLVGAYRGWSGPLLIHQTVEVRPGQNEVTLQLPPTERKEYALVRVRGPDGSPLAGVSFTTSFESDSGSMSGGGAYVVARPDGEYWVFHPSDGTSGDKGTCGIAVEHGKLGRQLVSYRAGEAPTFDIRFEEPATLDVVLEGLEGDRYAGRLGVQLLPDTDAKQAHLMPAAPIPVDAEGRAVVQGVQPGSFRLNLTLGRGPWGAMPIAEEKVTVRPGTQRVSVQLPTLYVVEIEGVTAQAHLHRAEADRMPRSIVVVQPGADGRAIVDGLIAGEYQLQMGAKVTKFRVPGTSKVRIE
ncbi:MAG: hypothetical protein AB7T63_11130 [Planctomycetota bacterium]